MNAGPEAGFTLTEMLVALLVLGVTASAMSTTMGTAFKSYERLSDVSDELRGERNLHSVFTDISNGYWLANGSKPELELPEILLPHPHFQKLTIEEIDGGWGLFAHAKEFDRTTVFTSADPLRMQAIGNESRASNVRNERYDYHTIQLQVRHDDWADLISVPLKVDADPQCRFDIVGRKCR